MARNTRTTRTTSTAPAESNGWDSVSVETAEPITRESKNGNRLEGTPFVAWLTQSKNDGEARRIGPVSADKGKEAEQLLRLAARQLGTGVKVKVKDAGNGNVTVSFQASQKKQFSGSARGTCSECGKTVVVRKKDGMISPHGPRDNRCSGSEQPPA